jgi:hypothetical protein
MQIHMKEEARGWVIYHNAELNNFYSVTLVRSILD